MARSSAMYLSFEQGMVKNALERHVHRFDPQAAHRTRRWSDSVTFSSSQPCDHEGASDGRGMLAVIPTASQPGPQGPQGRTHITRTDHADRERSTSPVRTFPGQKRLQGVVQIGIRGFDEGNVRVRISEIFDLASAESLGGMDVVLRASCEWQQPETLAIGFPYAAPAEQQPFGFIGAPRYVRSNGGARPKARETVSPERRLDLSPRRRVSSPRRRQEVEAFKGEAAESHTCMVWPFMKHLPGGTALQVMLREQKAKQGWMKKKPQGTNLSVLFSDLAAVLWKKNVISGRYYPLPRPPLLEEMIESTPQVTQNRWRRMLKIQEVESPTPGSLARLAMSVADALESQTTWFLLTPAETEGKKCVQLRYQAGPLCETRGKNAGTGWISLISVFEDLPAIARALEQKWGNPVDKNRMMKVAVAVERAESLKLCGGTSALEDKLLVSSLRFSETVTASNSNGLMPAQRGLNGIDAQWLLSALADTGQDLPDTLESGNVLRLLAICASEIGGLEVDNATSPAVGGPAARVPLPAVASSEVESRTTGEGGTAKDDPDNNGAEPQKFHFTVNTLSRFVKWYGPPLTTGGNRKLSPRSTTLPAPLGWASANKSGLHDPFRVVTLYKDARSEFMATCLDFCETLDEETVDLTLTLCTPMILEVVFGQILSVSPYVDMDSMVSDILWKICGWNTPVGRRNLRRLCRVFDRYASSHEMSRAVFLKICTDAGWANLRDLSCKSSRFNEIFDYALSSRGVENADFIDFLYMLEVIVEEILRPKNVMSSTKSFEPMWSCMEATISRLAGTTSNKTRQVARAAMSVKQPTLKSRNVLSRISCPRPGSQVLRTSSTEPLSSIELGRSSLVLPISEIPGEYNRSADGGIRRKLAGDETELDSNGGHGEPGNDASEKMAAPVV